MKILITETFKYTEEQRQTIENIGEDILYWADEKKKIDIEVSDIEYVICNGFFLYNDIKEFKSLKYIQVTSAGMDRLPMEYIKEKKITLFNARGVYSIPIAEWTILKILEIYKKSKWFYKKQEQHIWEKNRELIELNGKVACIIGYGSIGQEIAKRLKAFNVKIIAIDIKKIKSEYIDESYLINEINDIIKETDINILSLPLNTKTEKIINKQKLECMKDNSIFINIARGKLVDEKELIEQIKKNKFLGVILDVFENEPLETENELWDLERVIITPHNSFVSEKNSERLFQIIENNLKNIIRQ